MGFLAQIPTVAKAIAAAATAFAGAFAVAVSDNDVTTAEWITIGVAVIVATTAVWAVPNKPPATPPEVTPWQA